MEGEMNIYYDEEGDFLEITSGDLSNTYSKNLGNGVFEIINEKTGEVMGISVFKFKSRTKDLKGISLPFKFSIINKLN